MSDCFLTIKGTYFRLYYGENNLHSMKWWWCPICTRPQWIFIVLAHRNNSPRVIMLLLLEILSWFWAKESFLLLLKTACLAEKRKHKFQSLWFNLTGLEPIFYRIDTSKLTIIPPMRLWEKKHTFSHVNWISLSVFTTECATRTKSWVVKGYGV